MNKLSTLSLILAAATAATSAQADSPRRTNNGNPPVLVSRDLADPSSQVVQPSAWVTAAGMWRPTDERAPGATKTPGGAKAIHVEVRRQAGWSYWTLEWVDAKIPGDVKEISYWARPVGPDETPSQGTGGWIGEMHVNGTGATNAPWEGGADTKLGMAGLTVGSEHKLGEWQKYYVDSNAIQKIDMPMRINNISTWGNGAATTNCYEMCDLRVVTDVGGIPENERPWSLSITMPVTANAFYFGKEKPRFTVAAGSWIGVEKTIRCKASIRKFVEEGMGPEIPVKVPDMKVLDAASSSVDLPVSEPGAYVLTITASGMPEERTETLNFAIVREPPVLTEEQKKMSPYGVNIHGGGYVGYENFERIGMCWVRDYAYNFAWMKNARGAGLYGAWPWYPKIQKAAKDAGLYTLPCLMNGIACADNYGNKGPELPDEEWRRQMASIFVSDTFKDQCCWELDNERDAKVWPDSFQYGEWHRVFAEVLHAIRPSAWAVEEGGAGIHVNETRKHVLSGAYKEIDVLNGHNYAGGQPPERCRSNANANMSKGEQAPMYQLDRWRNWDRAGRADGKERQIWITEWGFDWLAGFVNTSWEQAAYMQREWVLALGAGVDKMFWYWYYDNAADAAHAGAYYDGMGMFSNRHQPRPITAAFCAMRAALPADMTYKGWASLGPNHMAHVLTLKDGSLVALAFKVDPKGEDLKITDPKAREVRDMFGATVQAGKRKLNIAPTWYLGLDPNCDWVQQAPMDVLSDTYVRNVSGEPLKVEVAGPDKYAYTVRLSAEAEKSGWRFEKRPWGFDVTGPAGLPRGELAFDVVGKNGNAEKTVHVDVNIVPQAYAKSNAADFDGSFTIDIVNQSFTNRLFNIVSQLPKGWVVEPTEQSTGDMEPESRKTLKFVLKNASPAVPASETKDIPKLFVFGEDPNGKPMLADYAPVIPREWSLKKAKDTRIDGDFKEWTDDYRMPSWMFGPRGDKETSKFYAAWGEEGVYAAVDVKDSARMPGDPDWFWRAQDCLELMVTTKGADFKEGKEWGLHDHQFIFMPFAETGEAGQTQVRPWAWLWGNCKGQDYRSYSEKDYPGEKFGHTKVSVAQTPEGYRMEIFIPKEYMLDWSPRKGEKIGFGWTIAVGGKRDRREAYWPASKGDNSVKRPWMWGQVNLSE